MEKALPQDPIPLRSVRVVVPREVTFDFERMQKVTANVLGRLGCPACHSGFDIRFHDLLDFAVDPETLEVREFAAHRF